MAEVRYPKIQEFLMQSFTRFIAMRARQTGRIPSQREFADYLGVGPASLSQWFTGQRPIAARWQNVLAEKLGPGIYEACDVPARLPENQELRSIVADWYQLNEAQQKEVLELMRKYAAGNAEEADDLASGFLPEN